MSPARQRAMSSAPPSSSASVQWPNTRRAGASLSASVSRVYDPDVIVRVLDDWPEPGPFVGRDAVMRQFEQLRSAWDADALEPISDFIEAGEQVVVRAVWRGTGTGPEANLEMTIVYTVRNRRVFYQEYFRDHAEALEAAGLQE